MNMPLGEYRIIEMADRLKSDLGLNADPDVQRDPCAVTGVVRFTFE